MSSIYSIDSTVCTYTLSMKIKWWESCSELHCTGAVGLSVLFGHQVVASGANVSELSPAPIDSFNATNASAPANRTALEASPLRPVSNFLMATVFVNDDTLTRPYHKWVTLWRRYYETKSLQNTLVQYSTVYTVVLSVYCTLYSRVLVVERKIRIFQTPPITRCYLLNTRNRSGGKEHNYKELVRFTLHHKSSRKQVQCGYLVSELVIHVLLIVELTFNLK